MDQMIPFTCMFCKAEISKTPSYPPVQWKEKIIMAFYYYQEEWLHRDVIVEFVEKYWHYLGKNTSKHFSTLRQLCLHHLRAKSDVPAKPGIYLERDKLFYRQLALKPVAKRVQCTATESIDSSSPDDSPPIATAPRPLLSQSFNLDPAQNPAPALTCTTASPCSKHCIIEHASAPRSKKELQGLDYDDVKKHLFPMSAVFEQYRLLWELFDEFTCLPFERATELGSYFAEERAFAGTAIFRGAMAVLLADVCHHCTQISASREAATYEKMYRGLSECWDSKDRAALERFNPGFTENVDQAWLQFRVSYASLRGQVGLVPTNESHDFALRELVTATIALSLRMAARRVKLRMYPPNWDVLPPAIKNLPFIQMKRRVYYDDKPPTPEVLVEKEDGYVDREGASYVCCTRWGIYSDLAYTYARIRCAQR
ncbi:hypothetical protein HKX48_003236 [Thoreauomyces humboldtii]|nr:hypothetical protein HKX48_003236 [Thoreauomyces humboldtii]